MSEPLYMYDNTGTRLVHKGQGQWIPESTDEFIARFDSGDACIDDLMRVAAEHPLPITYREKGMDFLACMTGILEGVSYRHVFSDHGFSSWDGFRRLTEFANPGMKTLFNMALKQRDKNRLARAEEALHERAVEGIDDPVYTQTGVLAGHRKKHSDRLLEVHLKALDPERYSDKHQHEFKGVVLNVNMGLRD